MGLKIEEIAAQRSFVFLWSGSSEGLNIGRCGICKGWHGCVLSYVCICGVPYLSAWTSLFNERTSFPVLYLFSWYTINFVMLLYI